MAQFGRMITTFRGITQLGDSIEQYVRERWLKIA